MIRYAVLELLPCQELSVLSQYRAYAYGIILLSRFDLTSPPDELDASQYLLY